mmetsp:Transcript_26275/g.80703  ORF Transcript_26275/g.80703 Transcript_26275/m.80703 type:complete len:214 (-) Transcript_26275:510-1151(-)
MPGRQRPERPLRWKPLALEYQTVRNADTFEDSLKKVLRVTPVSMTYTMSSTVMEVSARIVAMMTFRLPLGGGWKMVCCSAVGIRECSGCTSSSWPRAEPCSRLSSSAISNQPGMKTRMPPSSRSRWIDSTTSCARSRSTSSGGLACTRATSSATSQGRACSASETPCASNGTPARGPWEKAEGLKRRLALASRQRARPGSWPRMSSRKSSSMG